MGKRIDCPMHEISGEKKGKRIKKRRRAGTDAGKRAWTPLEKVGTKV